VPFPDPDGVTALVGAVRRHPAVTDVHLIGSRARGEVTELSDWDFGVDNEDPPRLAADLPELVAPLRPLAAQWERLSEQATFMVVLPDGVKVDLFTGGTRAVEPPWAPAAGTLAGIDAHTWDWLLWLGGKGLAGRDDLVRAELRRFRDHLLGPLGDETVPATVAEAVTRYERRRAAAEQRFGVSVDRRLGGVVTERLRAAGLLRPDGATPRSTR
jgi:hypothetical protein